MERSSKIDVERIGHFPIRSNTVVITTDYLSASTGMAITRHESNNATNIDGRVGVTTAVERSYRRA